MFSSRRPLIILVVAAALVAFAPRPRAAQRAAAGSAAAAAKTPALAQYLKPGMPVELVSAKKADRIAWTAYEEGKRNVFVASAPLFKPVRVTAFLEDDGTDLTELQISDDGGVVVFVRGTAPNRQGWVANPTSDPNGAERAIWAARVAAPGTAWRLAEGNNPQLSPDGRFVLYVKEGQIYRARVSSQPQTTPVDRGEKPFITAWGLNSGPKWSPDESKIAFSSNRTDHSFIGVYDMKTRTVSYLDPSVDRDTSPAWSPDGKRIAFLRRPGLPFGAQSTPGAGSGLPDVGAGRGGRGGFAPGGRGAAAAGQAGAAPAGPPPLANEPGLYNAALPSGATLAVMVADVATGAAKEAWHPAADDRTFGNINNIQWAGDLVIFPIQQGGFGRGGGGRGGFGRGGGGGRGAAQAPETPQAPAVKPADRNGPGDEESPKYYSLRLEPGATPVLLNSTIGILEDQTAWTLSKDGRTFFYCTNAVDGDPNDLDRRHIWAVPTAGGTPRRITAGDGIENVPVALANGTGIAVLSADAKRPMSVAIWPSDGSGVKGQSAGKVIYPTLAPDFPMSREVVPVNVTLTAADGNEFHNQLFLPTDIKPGEKRPAMIFVHGGPSRQMLLGWHYLGFYHVFYGVNQWLVSQGYIVLSVNYRSGVGYGAAFRRAPQVGGRGNAEYRDVLAAGQWLAARPDVDPNRVGIWGLSYGGLLTAEALARNSDIFKAGVDLAGVHLEGNSLDPADVSYTSSAISAIDTWKSPVLLIQGDDDRNVNFAQMVGLVELLRARHVYYELVVYPDDVHETLLHKRWLYSFDRMEAFLNRFLRGN